jgi:hypothetical protein
MGIIKKIYGKGKNLIKMIENTKTNKELDSINVVIYSYKGKDVIDTLEDLMKKRSNKIFIFIHWHDQNAVDRSKLLEDFVNSYNNCNGDYFHIKWDNNEGAVGYKDGRLKATFGGKYHMTITPGTKLFKNWDTEFIDCVKDKNIIISGNKQVQFDNSKIFYVTKRFSPISEYTTTSYIDRNLIFGNVVMMKKSKLAEYNFPGWLKYYGEEEMLSLQYCIDDIDVVAAPTNLVTINEYSTLTDFNYYVPFSKYHNYNQVIKLFKTGANEIVGNIGTDKIEKFSKKLNFNFSSLHYLPFFANDVSYTVGETSYDQQGGRRFIKQLNEIK